MTIKSNIPVYKVRLKIDSWGYFSLELVEPDNFIMPELRQQFEDFKSWWEECDPCELYAGPDYYMKHGEEFIEVFEWGEEDSPKWRFVSGR